MFPLIPGPSEYSLTKAESPVSSSMACSFDEAMWILNAVPFGCLADWLDGFSTVRVEFVGVHDAV